MNKCKFNGRCCRDLSNGIFEFENSYGEIIKLIITGGTCCYLDKETGDCTIYDRRPLVCKNYLCPYCKNDVEGEIEMPELLEMIRIETTGNSVDYILVRDIASLEVLGSSDVLGPTIIRMIDGKEIKVKISARLLVDEVGWVVRDLSPKQLSDDCIVDNPE